MSEANNPVDNTQVSTPARKYENWRECLIANPTITRKQLQYAKGKGCAGFAKSGVRILDFGTIKKWIEEHGDELGENESMAELREIKLREEITNTRLQNRKLEGKFLEPDEVREFLVSIATAQNAVLNKMVSELPPKVQGKNLGEIEKETKTYVASLISIFQKGIEEWMQ